MAFIHLFFSENRKHLPSPFRFILLARDLVFLQRWELECSFSMAWPQATEQTLTLFIFVFFGSHIGRSIYGISIAWTRHGF